MAGEQAIPNLKESCVFRMQLVVDAMPSCSWIAPDEWQATWSCGVHMLGLLTGKWEHLFSGGLYCADGCRAPGITPTLCFCAFKILGEWVIPWNKITYLFSAGFLNRLRSQPCNLCFIRIVLFHLTIGKSASVTNGACKMTMLKLSWEKAQILI